MFAETTSDMHLLDLYDVVIHFVNERCMYLFRINGVVTLTRLQKQNVLSARILCGKSHPFK